MKVLLFLLVLPACLPEFPPGDFVDDLDHDYDGDGQTENGGDCDDNSAAVYAGAQEICDGLNNDCDNQTDEIEDLEDGNYVEDPPIWYFDGDRDTFGSDNYAIAACVAPAGYADRGGDCDDSQPVIHPEAQEVCDGGIDNDCDGLADDLDDSMVGDATWYRDQDADGYGTEDETVTSCERPPGYALSPGDCDDTTVLVSPLSPERCDGLDNDCDGFTDDEDPEGSIGLGIWYADTDADGYGDVSVTTEACDMPSGYVADATDCDDTDSAISPGAVELCATVLVDDDCDGQVDESDADDAYTYVPDRDRDGFGDANAAEADMETACAPSTGFTADTTDCDDYRDTVYPGATELCSTPTLDESCDGDTNDVDADGCSLFYYDGDADTYGDSSDSQCQCVADSTTGYSATVDADCDDTVASVNPGATEDCASTADDNCDGDTNDDGAIGCTVYWHDNDNDGFGDSAQVVCICTAADPYDATADGDCNESDSSINPGAAEVCFDAVDNDCSGDADGADAIDASTWYLDDDGDGYGLTTYTQTACDQPSGYESVGGDCDDTRNGVNPGMNEDCLTSHDDDCSGSTNDVGATDCTTFYADVDGDGYGISADTQCTCTADNNTVYTSQAVEDCDDSDSSISPGDTETCATSGVDDDCDGTADEEDADDCDIYFYDGDGDGFGVNTTKCLCVPDGYYDASKLGDCDDADSTQYPGASSVLTNGSECGLNGSVTVDSAAVVLSGRQRSATHTSNDTIGFAVLDYNRDGLSDIVVGSPQESGVYVNSGAVYLWLGPVSSDTINNAGSADLRFMDDSLFAQRVGIGLSAADVDGDGFDEIGVWAGSGGQGYLLEEGLSGIGTVTSSTTGVSTFSDRRVFLHSDINDDGYDDGHVGQYVAYGSTSGLSLSTDSVTNAYTNAYVAPSSTVTGLKSWVYDIGKNTADINGDGYSDLIGGSDIYEGGPNWDDTRDAYINTGKSYEFSDRGIGDLDEDGYDDIAVGLPALNTTVDPYDGSYSLYGGAIYVYGGGAGSTGEIYLGTTTVNGTPTDVDWIIEGENNSQFYGQAESVGDLNGDNSLDLATGGYAETVSGSGGSVGIWYGPISFSGATSSAEDADAVIYEDNLTAIKAAGDVNADGYDDVWIGGTSLYLFHGTPN